MVPGHPSDGEAATGTQPTHLDGSSLRVGCPSPHGLEWGGEELGSSLPSIGLDRQGKSSDNDDRVWAPRQEAEVVGCLGSIQESRKPWSKRKGE